MGAVSLWFQPPGTVKISLGIERSVCSISVLLKEVTGLSESSIEWPGVSSSFYPYPQAVTSHCSLPWAAMAGEPGLSQPSRFLAAEVASLQGLYLLLLQSRKCNHKSSVDCFMPILKIM